MTKLVRMIARLDVKGEKLIKGVNLEGLRVLGNPQVFAEKYYHAGADEIIYMDLVASLYGRSHLAEIVRKTTSNVFVPLTVGGGIRSVEDVDLLLRAGADKVAINTAAVARPELIREVAQRFGSQCMVLSIEAKKIRPEKWEVYTDCGRETTGIDVVDWAVRGAALGAGEIMVTSIDQEGTGEGFDTALVKHVCKAVNVPIIASGGYGTSNHLPAVVEAGADAVAFADALHYSKKSLAEIREDAGRSNIAVRHQP